jgi:DtxR family Mn-dependent transcriptional regulator
MTEAADRLTPALEDYLETIYLIVRERKLARVKDIADMRGVKPGSVVPALRRLSGLGLIRYEQREFIDLTSEGEREARKTLTRHELLRRFFEEILQIPSSNAHDDACAMEHYLSDEGVDRLTRFFEFITRCPQGESDFIERFHRCPIVNPGQGECEQHCRCQEEGCGPGGRGWAGSQALSKLSPGESAVVSLVDAGGTRRRDLLDRGLLPGTRVTVEATGEEDGRIRIRVQGRTTTIAADEASCVFVEV